MMPIKCDNIVKNNLLDLTSKNPIIIQEKITSNENNIIGLSNKNIPHHVFNKKETNMGCDFPNKNVLQPFNGTNKKWRTF